MNSEKDSYDKPSRKVTQILGQTDPEHRNNEITIRLYHTTHRTGELDRTHHPTRPTTERASWTEHTIQFAERASWTEHTIQLAQRPSRFVHTIFWSIRLPTSRPFWSIITLSFINSSSRPIAFSRPIPHE